MSAVVGEVMLPAQREISGFGPVRSGVVTHALVLFFAIYFALGNIPRVLPIQVFRGAGIAASEPILYLLSALYIVIHINRIRFPTELFAASCILFLSTLWGILMHGLVAAPVFYSVRLAVAMISSFALGDALAQRYGGRLDQVLAGYIVLPLAVCTLIGWVIYLVFPDSVKLWLFLATLGIQFAGDPHSHRFISTFFDPQFFSCIVLMGILSVLALYQYKKASWHIPMLLFFGIALCLSLSRSGIATLLLVLATIGIFRVRLLRLSVKLVAIPP